MDFNPPLEEMYSKILNPYMLSNIFSYHKLLCPVERQCHFNKICGRNHKNIITLTNPI